MQPRIAVVIPCYNVERHISEVIAGLPAEVASIVVVDDDSPDRVSRQVRQMQLADPRITLVRHQVNKGVGGAMVTGYREALRLGADVVVKLDGDGQMDPQHLPALLSPLLAGEADYAKGNRWHDDGSLACMPTMRRLGSVALSFLAKIASGYWSVFDPCNGYTAVRAETLTKLRLEALAEDYYFETSMLVELSMLRAKVVDVPIPAQYGEEESSMRLSRVLLRFPPALLASSFRRAWRRYYVRDFGPVAMFLTPGVLLTAWGLCFGGWSWAWSILQGVPATAGTVMLAAMPFLMGFQLLLQAAVLDVGDEPKTSLCKGRPLGEWSPTLACRPLAKAG